MTDFARDVNEFLSGVGGSADFLIPKPKRVPGALVIGFDHAYDDAILVGAQFHDVAQPDT